MSTKRILVVTQCYPPAVGGIENLMHGLVQAFQKAGYTCDVIADGQGSSTETIVYFGGLKPLRRYRKRRMITRAPAYDAIICDSWKSISAIPPTPTPIICLAHGAEVSDRIPAKKHHRIRQALARATWIVANSSFTAQLSAQYTPAEKVRVITPGITPLPAPDPDFRVEGAPVITTICRLEPRKGVDRLISAMSEVTKRYPQAKLVIAGSGPDQARLEQLAQGRANITFLGRISEAQKSALLHQTDVFAMPVRQEGTSVEGFGIVYLEAAMCGAPSLAGKTGGAVDAVLDGQTGLTCHGEDQDDVTQKLLELLATDKASWSAALYHHAHNALWSHKIVYYLDLLSTCLISSAYSDVSKAE